MSAPKELPGFYFDAEKNRYFPIKGPIPGSSRKQPSSSSASGGGSRADAMNAIAADNNKKRKRSIGLLQAREIEGNVILSNKRACSFGLECQKMLLSRPVVWKYKKSKCVGESALEHLRGTIQTEEGVKEAKILIAGNMCGCLRLYEIENIIGNPTTQSLPEAVWPLNAKNTQCDNCVQSIWWGSDIEFPSSITSIKGIQVPGAATTELSRQRLLVTTLGCGSFGGSVYVADVWDEAESIFDPFGDPSMIASFKGTVWASDCDSSGRHAVIGTNLGSAELQLETGRGSLIFQSESDVISQKFVGQGNTILCGLRNGAIVPVDKRQRNTGHGHIFSNYSLPHRRYQSGASERNSHRSGKRSSQANGKGNLSNMVCMPSAVCSLASLQSEEQYFLGSSMDGSIMLFDLRLLQRGAVQSYAGHVNSHTRLQLAVGPSETLVMSGGEDSVVRIWSIKDGELIFAENVADSVCTSICWPQSDDDSSSGSWKHGNNNNSWSCCSGGAWLGSRSSLCYLQGGFRSFS